MQTLILHLHKNVVPLFLEVLYIKKLSFDNIAYIDGTNPVSLKASTRFAFAPNSWSLASIVFATFDPKLLKESNLKKKRS